jgi:hypothetical protein
LWSSSAIPDRARLEGDLPVDDALHIADEPATAQLHLAAEHEELVARDDGAAERRVLDPQERRELGRRLLAVPEVARELRARLDLQHARHERAAREVTRAPRTRRRGTRCRATAALMSSLTQTIPSSSAIS